MVGSRVLVTLGCGATRYQKSARLPPVCSRFDPDQIENSSIIDI
jgi:hypothetical protein